MTDFRPIIADLAHYGFGVNKIAMRLNKQFIQIKRIQQSGRAEHGLGEELLALHREICLQNVPRSPAIEMRTA